MASGYAPSPSTIAQGQAFNGGQPAAAAPAAGKFGAVGIDKLRQIKAASPGGKDMSDAQFALALHEHYYSDVPLTDFLKGVGLDRGDVLYETRAPDNVYGDYVRKALATPGAGESADAAAKRQGGSIERPKVGTAEGMARAYLQGGTLGFGDEIVAAGAAALDPLVHGNRGKDFGQRFDAYMGREQGKVDDFRAANPVAAYGTEIAGSIPTMLMAPSPGAGAFPRLATDLGLGLVYGYGSTDGSVADRAKGAIVGGGLGVAGGIVGNTIGRAFTGAATKAAARRAINSAPPASAISASSKAAFRASEGTGARISQPALATLRGNVRQLAADEGLLLPSGKVTSGYSKAKGALKVIDAYAQGPINMKQAQALLKVARGVSKMPGSEGDFGRKLVKEIMDHFDAMRPTDFVVGPANHAGATLSGGNGQAAVQYWKQGMADWARFKRTDAVEKIVRKAELAPGGFADGLRAGFRKVLTNARRQQGFSKDELAAIERFVKGGPADEFLRFIQKSGVMGPVIAGHVAGGLPGAVAAGGAKLGASLGAGALRNSGAARAGAAIRARAAGVPFPTATAPRLPIAAGRVGVGVALPASTQQRAAFLDLIDQVRR